MDTEKIRKYGFIKDVVLQEYTELYETRSRLMNLVFQHDTFYSLSRDKFETNKLKAQEAIAQDVSSAFDDLLLTADIIEGDIDTLMQAKQKFIKKISIYLPDVQKDKLDTYIVRLIGALKDNIEQEEKYDEVYTRLSEDFSEYKMVLNRHPEVLRSLGSAEFLYYTYIWEKTEIERFDYSCVSIMYYIALEELLNKIVYFPYLKKCVSKNREAAIRTDKYFVKPNKYMRGGSFKHSCELGPLAYLLINIMKTVEFKDFVKDNFGIVNIDIVSNLGKELLSASTNRNDAAHGGTVISYRQASDDKEIVYYKEAMSLRGLINKTLEVFVGKIK